MKHGLTAVLVAAGLCMGATPSPVVGSAGSLEPRLVQRDGKWLYLVEDGRSESDQLRPVGAARYDWATAYGFEDNAVVANGGRYGVVDRVGKVLVPLEYDYAWPYANDMAVVVRDGKYGAVDRSGRLAVPLEYDYIAGFSGAGRSGAVKGNRWGVIDRSGRERLPFEYLIAGSTQDTGFMRGFDGKWNVFDRDGRRFPSEHYADINEYPDALVVRRDGKKWLLDWNERPLLEGGYDDLSYQPAQRIAIATRDGRVGAYDLAAKRWIVPVAHADVLVEHNGLLLVTTDGAPGKAYLIDRAGRKLGNADYDADSIGFKTGYDYAWMKRDGAWGLIDAQGRQIVPFVAREHDRISVGSSRITVQARTGWGLVDKQGRVLMPFEYDRDGNFNANPFHSGLGSDEHVVVHHRPSARHGVLDAQLQWALPLGRYDRYGTLSHVDQLVPVVKDGRYGLYDLAGRREVVAPAYASMSIENGYSSTVVDRDAALYRGEDNIDRWDLITHGDWTHHAARAHKLAAYHADTQRLLAYRGNKCGLMPGYTAGTRMGLLDKDGRAVVPMEYAYLSRVHGLDRPWYYAEKGGKAGYIDANGREVMPFRFDAWPAECESRGDFFYNGYVQLHLRGERVLADAAGNVVARAGQFGFPRTPYLSYVRVGNMWLPIAVMKSQTLGDDRNDQYRFLLDGQLYEAYGSRDASSQSDRFALPDGRLLARRNGKYGWLDQDGRIAIAFEWDEAHPFEGGMAYAKHQGHWHVINRDGTIMRHSTVRLAFLARG